MQHHNRRALPGAPCLCCCPVLTALLLLCLCSTDCPRLPHSRPFQTVRAHDCSHCLPCCSATCGSRRSWQRRARQGMVACGLNSCCDSVFWARTVVRQVLNVWGQQLPPPLPRCRSRMPRPSWTLPAGPSTRHVWWGRNTHADAVDVQVCGSTWAPPAVLLNSIRARSPVPTITGQLQRRDPLAQGGPACHQVLLAAAASQRRQHDLAAAPLPAH